MALILPALAFVALAIYEFFSNDHADDQPYPESFKVKPVPRRRR